MRCSLKPCLRPVYTIPDYFSHRINFTLTEKFVGVYTTPFHSVVRSYFCYRTGINCYNVVEYIHNNNTFIMLLTKIFIELYVTNVYCRYDSN